MLRAQSFTAAAKRAGMLLAGVLLAGCSMFADEAPVVEADAADAEPGWVEAVQLARVDIQVKRGEDIGSLEGGTLCLPNEDLIYGKDRATVYPDELSDIFLHELEAARYRVISDPVATVENPGDWKAERMIVPKVFRMQANICYPGSGVGQWKSKGAAAVAVEWQIHSRAGGGPIYTLQTEGYAQVESSRYEGDKEVFRKAFGAAVRNMLNDRLFTRQITRAAQTPTADTPAGFLPISGAPVSQRPIAERLAAVRANVVKIAAGESGGAGFFIDQGRHVLTTAGTVGRAARVTVILADGTEVLGTVLLANGRRGVALIATEPVDVDGLPLMIDMPAVGEAVFAPGVTRPGRPKTEPAVGVITAIREDGGLTLIQSTIASAPGIGGGPLIDAHGNVVGIAANAPQGGPDSEDSPDSEDKPLDVSFFVPVKDALDGLGVLVERPKLPEPVMPDIREASSGGSMAMETAKGPNGKPVPRPAATAPRFEEPLPKPEPPLPGIWRSRRDTVWGYEGFGGGGDGVTVLSKVPMKMVERRATWGLFSYHTPRGPGQKWIRLADVQRDAFHWSDTIKLPEGM